ncbi:MAG: peptide chain release factor 1 [Gammaproteobacteria bacterium]|nr:peptide chain release factor 1 [Gammaproteobacteria bacterium]MDA7596580.1 peptide chain release factor 1 [Gammaproteobacteria bacterium]MDC0225968.1 peptide chain release factor 1 [Gammaproteobacteria bacterium]MDC3240494.1 peptide chain release factor 1 [Gammaproteobacteria bacterium]RZO95715.1 MAG: peptide chain release factor 1 [Gammaproteobacteria bacterium]|tara:strand:+ start:1312 stop:2394 length:1083 start_codon:yes stop_codon:yes gene_type:complete
MKRSIVKKLELIQEQYHSIANQLADEGIQSDGKKMVELSKEFSRIEPVVVLFEKYQSLEEEKQAAEELIKDDDGSMSELAKEEIDSISEQLIIIQDEITPMLLSSDSRDGSNVFLEIRAGTGGDEAAIFAGDVFRMYARFCEKNSWSLEILNQNETGQGGFKEIIAKVIGSGVFAKLKFESGTHRVQRIPKTESQGRIHTSACTVAIIAEADEMNEVEISNNDVRVDTYRASGAGGQHVNKTDSAVRLTHIPTGIVAECQDNRSQHKNRAKAVSLLKAKIYDMEQKKIQDQQAEERKMLVGSGDRSERIRTYNYPQGRITDHRINLTQYNLAEFMEGDLDTMIDTLVQENAAKQMAQLDD